MTSSQAALRQTISFAEAADGARARVEEQKKKRGMDFAPMTEVVQDKQHDEVFALLMSDKQQFIDDITRRDAIEFTRLMRELATNAPAEVTAQEICNQAHAEFEELFGRPLRTISYTESFQG